ncbi:Heavy-metal resistance [Cognatiyoonia koreensis]|uniref:Heavy-metal resistance n=1 Tax=Cognatiyoonia koreensis TaxID=364200 RepID=A0A1I0QFJ6_9RHOB|nr:periplasmic heavy metal sensor [Cognatiyoonia koreensis]SEW25382.1 Heavy-metal resistance [Cognatiyoonia koreensis]
MADPQTAKPRRLWRVLFALSLALNLAVVGVVIGVGMRDRVGGQPPRGFDVALGPIGQALRPEDRRAIGQALRRDPALGEVSRREARAQIHAVAVALTASPFSPEALDAVLASAAERMSVVQQVARRELVARVAEMSDAERAALADRIKERRRSGASR